MQAKIDTAAKTLTIQYEDDIDLLILWASLNIGPGNMLNSVMGVGLSPDTEAGFGAKLAGFFTATYPIWDVLDDHLLAANIIIRP